MTIRDLFRWGKKEIAAPFVSTFGGIYASGLSNQVGKKYLEEYRNWVFACVQARAEEVGNIELELYKGEEEVDNHEVLELLYRVNPLMTMQDLFMGTQAFLDLEGNSFWFLARENDGKGAVQEIYLLRPDKVTIVPDENNPLLVAGYTYRQQDGKQIPFNANEILHFKNFNPVADHPFPYRGMGIVQAASWAIDSDNEAREWNYAFFKNSARPDGFLTKEGTIDEAEFKRLKLMWEQEHQGSSRAHKIAVLSGGLKWEDISRSQKDMDFIEQRRFSRDEILALFRVPKSVIGIVEDVNRANAEASDYIFAKRTIEPLMRKIVNTLNEFLIPEFGEDLYFEFESPVPDNRTEVVNEYALGIDKWLTRNEIREEEGLPPTENGNQIMGTLAQTPIDVLPPQPQKPMEDSFKQRHRIKRKSTAEKVIEDFVAKLPTEKEAETPRALSEVAKNNYVEMWKKSFGVEVGPLKKQLDAFMRKQEAEVIRNIEEETKGLESKEFQFKAISDFMFNPKGAITSTIAIITPNIRRYIKQAGEQASLLVGAGIPFDPTNARSVEFISERARYFAETYNQTTADGLMAQLREGIAANESTEQLSARVAQFYDGEINYRSDRAARTEVSASSNFGAEEAYVQAGVEKMQWLVVAPEDVDCLDNDGEVREVGDEFPSGNVRPPVHPNCVCTLLPYFGK